MKQVYHSIEELLSNCANSDLKSLVSSVLKNNKYMEWCFVTGSVDNDACRAEFISKMESPDLKQHLSCVKNASGVRWNISTTAPASTVV